MLRERHARRRRWKRSLFVLLALALLPVAPIAGKAAAQDGPSSAGSVGSIGESGGPLRDNSGPVGDTSVRGMLDPSMSGSGGAVREPGQRGMLSGPIREQGTAGRVADGGPVSGKGSIGASTAGAVRGMASQPQVQMERPVSRQELEDLEQQLREIQPLAEE